MTRRMVATVLGVALLAGAGCGDDDEDATDEYCDIARELAGDDEPTDEELDEYVEAAPEEIRDEAELVVDAIQERGEEAFEDPEVLDAVDELEEFEAEECGVGDDDDTDDTTDDTTDETTDDTTEDTSDAGDDTTSTTDVDATTTTTMAG